MATDYDAPRRGAEEEAQGSLEELTSTGPAKNAAAVDVDDVDDVEAAESFELPGADLAGEELTVRVLPKQQDEFTCTSCFLVRHHSQLASTAGSQQVCAECAA